MALASFPFPFHELPTEVTLMVHDVASPLTRTLLALTCKAELARHPLLDPVWWYPGYTADYPNFRCAPKRWRRALIREAIALNNGVILHALLQPWVTNHWILERAVATGCLDALEPLFDAGHFMGKKLVAHFIRAGNTAVLEVIIAAWRKRGSPSDRGCIWDESTFHHVFPMFWYSSRRETAPIFSDNAMCAMKRGCPVSSYFVSYAIRKKDHAFLRLAHKNGYRWRPREIHEAIKYSNNMETVELLLSFGCPLDQHALGYAYGEVIPRIPLIQLLLNHNCPFDEEYTRRGLGAYANCKMDNILAILRALSLVQ